MPVFYFQGIDFIVLCVMIHIILHMKAQQIWENLCQDTESDGIWLIRNGKKSLSDIMQ